MNRYLIPQPVLALILLGVTLSGCKKDEEDPATPAPTPLPQVAVNMQFYLRDGPQPVQFGNMTIEDGAGRIAYITRIRCLVSNIRLTDAGGNTQHTFPGAVVLFDSNDPTGVTSIGLAPTGGYGALKIDLGLDDVTNAMDPSQFSGPPLTDQSLYVNGASGYRFFSIEGRTDADDDGIVDTGEPSFSYTCITSAMRRTDVLQDDGFIGGQTSGITLGFDIQGLLNGIDVMDDLSETGSGALNAQLMSNLQTAVEVP